MDGKEDRVTKFTLRGAGAEEEGEGVGGCLVLRLSQSVVCFSKFVHEPSLVVTWSGSRLEVE